MTIFPTSLSSSSPLIRRRFAYRSLLPLSQDYLWQIETGAIRTATWLKDGTPITIGLWGSGDIVGKALSKADPYRIECLTDVEATALPLSKLPQLTQSMVLHAQQLGEFLEILHSKPVDAALLRLLIWLSQKFGRETNQGKLIDLRLTHRDIAEIISSSRVTVTRLLNEFEKQGIIQSLGRKFVVTNEQPFWHYEI